MTGGYFVHTQRDTINTFSARHTGLSWAVDGFLFVCGGGSGSVPGLVQALHGNGRLFWFRCGTTGAPSLGLGLSPGHAASELTTWPNHLLLFALGLGSAMGGGGLDWGVIEGCGGSQKDGKGCTRKAIQCGRGW